MDDESTEQIVAKIKHTLFTNVSFVQLQGTPLRLRLDAYALLLEDGALGIFGKDYRLRGFGPDPAWPVFTYHLDGPIEYKVTAAKDESVVMLSSTGKKIPIFGGSILSIENGPQFFLQSSDPKQPLDIFESVGDIGIVWRELERRVAKYWQAPFMPHSSYGPPGYWMMEAAREASQRNLKQAERELNKRPRSKR